MTKPIQMQLSQAMPKKIDYPLIIRAWFSYRNPLYLLDTWTDEHIKKFMPGSIQVYDWETNQYRSSYLNWTTTQVVNWLRKAGYKVYSARLVYNQFNEDNRGIFVLVLEKRLFL